MVVPLLEWQSAVMASRCGLCAQGRQGHPIEEGGGRSAELGISNAQLGAAAHPSCRLANTLPGSNAEHDTTA